MVVPGWIFSLDTPGMAPLSLPFISQNWRLMTFKFINKLFQWSKQNRDSLVERIKETWNFLHKAQNSNNMEQEQRLQKELEQLLMQEELYWWQRSRIR